MHSLIRGSRGFFDRKGIAIRLADEEALDLALILRVRRSAVAAHHDANLGETGLDELGLGLRGVRVEGVGGIDHLLQVDFERVFFQVAKTTCWDGDLTISTRKQSKSNIT